MLNGKRPSATTWRGSTVCTDKIEARFYDPGGNQISTSADERFVGPKETAVDFSGVALIPNAAPIAPGSYKVALYSDDRLLTEQRFDVTPDLKARAATIRRRPMPLRRPPRKSRSAG